MTIASSPRRIAALALAVAFVAGAIIALPTRAQAPQQNESSCVAIQHMTAPPLVMLINSSYDMTSTVTTLCAGESEQLNVVLVLDGSSSMAGTPATDVKRNARELIDRLDLKDHPRTSIGVVEINQPSKVLCELTNRASQATGCVGRVGAAGGSDIAGALRIALESLRRGRDVMSEGGSISEVVVVVTDGGNAGGCDELLRTANEAKAQGVVILSACVTPACADACVRTMATSPAHHFPLSEFRGVIDAIMALERDGFTATTAVEVAITETLANNFALGSGGVHPEPTFREDDSFVWRTARVPKDGVTVSLSAKPYEAGPYQPMMVTAKGSLLDSRGRVTTFDFRIPRVDVLYSFSNRGQPTPVAATTPLTNVLTVDRRRVPVGQTIRAHYQLQLPPGDAERLNVATIYLALPDHLRILAAWRDGRPDGQLDLQGRGAQWLVFGSPGPTADAYDFEIEAVVTAQDAGGIGVMAYGWDGRDNTVPIAAAVSDSVIGLYAATPVPPGTLPTSTATPRGPRIFLPMALAEACVAGPPNDVVAVIDTSLSMTEQLPGGGRKLEAAAAALEVLVDRLNPARDRIALVTFDRTAVVRRPLGDVGSGIVDALRHAPVDTGTAMGAGLLAAGAVLASPDHRREARAAVIVLTDGRSSPDGPEGRSAAYIAADALRAAGTLIFAVGVGSEVDRGALDGIAGGRGEARVVGDAASLGSAFGSIGGRLGCTEVAVGWGGRLQ